MKPDWKDAPSWANYLAQDEDGDWYWYEKEPRQSCSYWVAQKCTEIQYVSTANTDWRETLENKAERKRAANRKHRADVNSVASSYLMTKAGITKQQADVIVASIAKNEMPNIFIKY